MAGLSGDWSRFGSIAAAAVVTAEILTQHVPGTTLIPAVYDLLRIWYYPHFMDEDTEAQRGEGRGPQCTAIEWQRPDDRASVGPLLSAVSPGERAPRHSLK